MQILDWLCERDDGLAHLAAGEREAAISFALLWMYFEARLLNTRASVHWSFNKKLGSPIAATMPFANKQLRNRRTVQHDRTRPHVPMGDQRFQQLMSELGAAFAQVDDGEGKRRQARERSYQHELWLTQRQATIVEIIAIMRQHGLSVEDLV